MKKLMLILGCLGILSVSCSKNENSNAQTAGNEAISHSQDGVQDDISNPNIVQLAVKIQDLSTLVQAVKAADLVTSLSNAGPFTVFAPVNSAFDKLPKGTVEDLLKPENKSKLSDILGYHTYVGVIQENQFTDGQTLGMVSGKSITIKMENGKPVINGKAHILSTVPASNGIIYVIDEVLLP